MGLCPANPPPPENNKQTGGGSLLTSPHFDYQKRLSSFEAPLRPFSFGNFEGEDEARFALLLKPLKPSKPLFLLPLQPSTPPSSSLLKLSKPSSQKLRSEDEGAFMLTFRSLRAEGGFILFLFFVFVIRQLEKK